MGGTSADHSACEGAQSSVATHAGVYEIVSRDARKTSFAYKLEIPEEPGEVQQELQIKKEASYTISMKVLLYLQRHSVNTFPVL